MLQMINHTGRKPIQRGCGWPSSKSILPLPLRQLPRLALLGVIVLGSTLPGCVVPADHADSNVAGISAMADLSAGVYWIERDAENATLYPLDNVRADETLTLTDVDWYTGAGWYELSGDGEWTARLDLSDLTLDDVLQVQNPVREIP